MLHSSKSQISSLYICALSQDIDSGPKSVSEPAHLALPWTIPWITAYGLLILLYLMSLCLKSYELRFYREILVQIVPVQCKLYEQNLKGIDVCTCHKCRRIHRGRYCHTIPKSRTKFLGMSPNTAIDLLQHKLFLFKKYSQHMSAVVHVAAREPLKTILLSE